MKNLGIALFILAVSALLFGCTPPKPPDNTIHLKNRLTAALEYEEKEDYVAAQAKYEEALTFDPGNEPALSGIARMEEKRSRAAEDHYQGGMRYLKKGMNDAAIAGFNAALSFHRHEGAKMMLYAHGEGLKTGYAVYIVKEKDSLPLLAEHFYKNAKMKRIIADFNRITEDASLKAGKELMIPYAGNSVGTERYILHTADSGDSISKLAFVYYGSYKKWPIIAKYNKMANATDVKVGQKVKIPETEAVSLDELGSIKAMHEQWELYIREGMAHLRGDNYQDAVSEFKKALNLNIRRSFVEKHLLDAYLGLAGLQYRAEEWAGAKSGYRSALELDKNCRDCIKYIKICEERLKDAKPDDADRKRAVELLAAGKYQEAITGFENYRRKIHTFNRVQKKNFQDPGVDKYLTEAHFKLGVAQFDSGEYARAKSSFMGALGFDNSCPDCTKYIKLCNKAMEKPAEKPVAEKPTEDRPEKPAEEAFEKGLALNTTGEYRQAIPQFKKYLEEIDAFNQKWNADFTRPAVYTELSKSHYGIGMELYGEKKFPEAIDRFRAALKNDDSCRKCSDYIKRSREEYLSAHYMRGHSFFGHSETPQLPIEEGLKDLETAIREFELVSDMEPGYKDVALKMETARNRYMKLKRLHDMLLKKN